jgi:hypothetical protein
VKDGGIENPLSIEISPHSIEEQYEEGVKRHRASIAKTLRKKKMVVRRLDIRRLEVVGNLICIIINDQ